MTAGLSKVTVDNPSCGSPAQWQLGMTINGQSDGTITLSYADGSVLSVQPDGSWQTRPKGTAGAFEKATLGSAWIAYGYQWSPGAGQPSQQCGPFVYLFLPAVPNS